MTFVGMRGSAVELTMLVLLSIVSAVALSYLVSSAWQTVLQHVQHREWRTVALKKARCVPGHLKNSTREAYLEILLGTARLRLLVALKVQDMHELQAWRFSSFCKASCTSMYSV